MPKGDSRVELSLIQREIIEKQGNLAVRASAGTGKTHTMVNKILNEIENNKSHKVIAAITFTIKAANEINERISIDTSHHFIGTNNSFVVEEIIKPFMKDAYGKEFDIEMETDYSVRGNDFEDCVKTLKENAIICSYRNSKKNFIFDLALKILKKSEASQLYLKSKYFKIYIDEYQDCDNSMHQLFMYICDELNIDVFIVGDEKQSIYMWRGAHPDAFMSVFEKTNFNNISMNENFRSCIQIQNYSNLLCEETKHLYIKTDNLGEILLISSTANNWVKDTIGSIDSSKSTALLRYRNNDAQNGAEQLSINGIEFKYIPTPPINYITTTTSWLYNSVAKYVILEKYSVYDLISEIPVEGNEDKAIVSILKKKLERIYETINKENLFYDSVNELADYLGYETRLDELSKLFNTISDEQFHVAFDYNSFKNIAITFHSSKGLEFDQVIIFAEDYRLDNLESIYNHYVAVTRAKDKLIIVSLNNNNSNIYRANIEKIFIQNGIEIKDVIKYL